LSNIDQTATLISADLLAVVLGGTDSLLQIELANGFCFEKINLANSPFRDKDINSKGKPFDKYCFSEVQPASEDEVDFICLTKQENFP